MQSFGKFFALCLVLCAACAEAATTNVSNAVTVKGWKREHLTFDTESNRFSRAEFPTLAEAEAAAELAEELPGLYVAATNALATNLAPVYVATTNHKAKTVVALTGAASLDNLLDRQNITMAVVSNEVTRNANGTRSIRAWVAENFVTKSPPVMKARLRTISGEDEWIEAEWADGWTNATTITLVHPQSYTNFVVATVTNEATVVLTTNVVFESIEDAYRPVVATNRTEYQGLDYIQFYQGAFIDTLVIPASDALCEIRMTYSSETYINDMHLFGTTIQSGNAGSYTHFTTYSSRYYWGLNDSELSGGSWSSGKHSVVFNTPNGYYVLLDGNVLGSGRQSCSLGSLTIGRRSGTANLYAKVYSFDVIPHDATDTVRLRHLVPILDAQDVAMFDVAHEKVYYNIGSATLDPGSVTGTVYGASSISTNYVHYCVTNSETRAITLTNQVIVVTDGTIPRIVTKGDREELQCHPLDYTIPATVVPPDLSRWVRIGHPDTGFDFGNRALRVNGVTTLTTNDLNFLGDFMVYTNGVPVSVTNDFTFFADNGLLKVAERSTITVSGVNL